MSRFRRYFTRWQNWIGLLLILGYVGVAVLAPVLSPNDPKDPGPFLQVGKRTRTLGEPQPPNEKAPLGMLPFGVDVYHALVWGARGALSFGLIVTSTTALFGILYGAISGFAGNRLSSFMLRVADAFLAFPPIAGVVLLQQLYLTSIQALGGQIVTVAGVTYTLDAPPEATLLQSLLGRVDPLMLSLILFSWMPYARLVHSIVLTLKQTEFVQAARALGGSPFWIIRKHLLQNSTGPAIVIAARDVGGVVLFQATLTFIGIGGNSVWGEMLVQGRNWIIGPGGNLLGYWWVFLPPTLAVMLFGIAWNMFGDSLNDVLDPTSYYHTGFRRMRQKDKEEPSPEKKVLPGPVSAISSQALPSAGSPANRAGVDPVLLAAREALSQGDLSRALHAYNHLIQRNRLIEEILPDLAQMVKKLSHEPQVWQMLGDALDRTGDSVHAAQSYEQAQRLRQ